jgi:hypothetical protein
LQKYKKATNNPALKIQFMIDFLKLLKEALLAAAWHVKSKKRD